jgi:predicted amidophosphoribosyltransferase
MAAEPERTAPAELNVVSGGYVECPSCGAHVTRLRSECPSCDAAIDWSSLRITRDRRRPRRLARVLRIFG